MLFSLLKFKKNLFQSSRAETLLEVVIAIGVVSIGAATAANVAIQSLRSSAFARDALVAQNLAMEGLEVVRNLRDTNWIKFNFDQAGCWNQQPTAINCATTNALTDDQYTITNAGLEKTTETLNTADLFSPSNDPFRLHYYDLDSTINSDDDDALNKDTNDRDAIFNKFTAGDPITEVGPTKYYRQISLNFQSSVDPGPVDLVEVISTVYWLDAGSLAQVSLSNLLSATN